MHLPKGIIKLSACFPQLELIFFFRLLVTFQQNLQKLRTNGFGGHEFTLQPHSPGAGVSVSHRL